MLSSSSPLDDALTCRNSWSKVTAHLNGAPITVSIPSGYRLISAAELLRLEDATQRAWEKYTERVHTAELAAKIAQDNEESYKRLVLFLENRLNQSQQARKTMAEDLVQLRSIISSPIRWVYRTLRGRALSLERNLRKKEIQSHITAAEQGFINYENHRLSQKAGATVQGSETE